MIRSMTGYGRSDAGEAGNRFGVEVRSLNNRYLDVQVKAPRGLMAVEPRVKKMVQDRFSRGRFDVVIVREIERDKSGTLVVDEALAARYIDALRHLKVRFGLAGEVDLSLVAALPDLVAVTEAKDDLDAIWKALGSGLALALDDLDRMRCEEGSVLVRDIGTRIGTIEGLVQSIQAKSPATVENARKRMADSLARLLAEQPDPARLAQEIAILAERMDVTEELTRLGSHIGQFRAMLADPREAVGRKLDFLIQEMGREVNTIASKAMDSHIAMDAVSIKAELEKIREQAQNIE